MDLFVFIFGPVIAKRIFSVINLQTNTFLTIYYPALLLCRAVYGKWRSLTWRITQNGAEVLEVSDLVE